METQDAKDQFVLMMMGLGEDVGAAEALTKDPTFIFALCLGCGQYVATRKGPT